MNGVDLFLLGRTLMKIGEAALPTEGVGAHSTSVRTVLIVAGDVRDRPGGAVGEIAARTGLPQSAVSGAVARLREAGAVVTEPDPRDRRRLLVRPAPEASARVAEVRATPIDAALSTALDTDDPERLAAIVALLDELARHVTPQALTRLRE
ncbi:MarR family transcriptional regulator [Actinomadura sp. CNU-125]|uniref:MarR family winged helix-turn-helix transcriptional regulator n=1 Tax=Actinomadura sp. CNU-125 TaxID=1904961 RepID=UPI000967F25A|nr:MarR family transcriptional regulator [Actinomadura sp. CNU-125]OLT38191.1 MarR family transcriptional regulator [Actinomadura sp. CNU-125]